MWCLLGAEDIDCQFYGCRMEKVIFSLSNQICHGFFASVAEIPCCLASCSGWVGSTAFWYVIFWLLGEASALCFDSVIQTQTKLVNWVIQEKQMGNINRLCFIKGQAFMYSFACAKPSPWSLTALKKSPTNQACGLLPAYLWAFLGLPCRWPWIISSICSVGHSSWSVSAIYQTSWFTHSFWVSVVNFVVHLEERVQKQDSGNLLFKPWKMFSCRGLMVNNGWCSSLLSNRLLEHILKN